MPNPDTITITAGNQNVFAPASSTVPLRGTVVFQGSSGTVDTLISKVSSPIFTSGSPPYAVPGTYKVKDGISGNVKIKFKGASGPLDGANGTINVGGNEEPE
jgi:hypothetical protein